MRYQLSCRTPSETGLSLRMHSSTSLSCDVRYLTSFSIDRFHSFSSFLVLLQTGMLTALFAISDLLLYLTVVRASSLQPLEIPYTNDLSWTRLVHCAYGGIFLELSSHNRQALDFQLSPFEALWVKFLWIAGWSQRKCIRRHELVDVRPQLMLQRTRSQEGQLANWYKCKWLTAEYPLHGYAFNLSR